MTDVKIQMLVRGNEVENFVPRKAHKNDAGFDCFAAFKDTCLLIPPGETKLVPLGFKIQLEEGYEAQIRSRSGNSLNKHFIIANSPGTVDCGYTNEVCAIILNTSNDEDVFIHRGDKVAQMVINKLPEVNMIEVSSIDEDTERGDNGFGSTDKEN